MTIRHNILLLMTTLTVMLTSCNHKDLYVENYDLNRVMVNFDFKDTGKTPSAMRVFFYPIETNARPYMFDVSGSGGYVRLPKGTYNVLAYNVDTENVIEYRPEVMEEFQLTTHGDDVEEVAESSGDNASTRMLRTVNGEKLPMGDGEGSFRYYDAPEWTCVARSDSVAIPSEVTERTADGEEQSVVVMTPRPAVCTVNITVTGVEGLSRAAMARGTLSGVAAATYPALGHASTEAGFVAFNTRISQSAGTITSTFYVWAPRPYMDTETRQVLNIYIWANSGNFYASADVTEQLQKAWSDQQATASFDLGLNFDIDLTQGATGDSGFEPSVNDWEVIHSGISL